eukprot:3701050-Rhodomonas_salina.2
MIESPWRGTLDADNSLISWYYTYATSYRITQLGYDSPGHSVTATDYPGPMGAITPAPSQGHVSLILNDNAPSTCMSIWSMSLSQGGKSTKS